MAGFTLPKFRWLVLGAAAAGVWAMMQDVPPRGAAPAPQSAGQNQKATPERVTRRQAPAAEQAASAAPETPRAIQPPEQRPAPMVTSSIPRPMLGVGEKVDGRKLFATSRVRMRKDAGTSAAIVTTLQQGQAVKLISKKGDWRLVSTGGATGWVREDFLSGKPVVDVAAKKPAKPKASEEARPKMLAPPPRPLAEPVMALEQPQRQPAPLGRVADWGSMRPSRTPQGGDCQCPYDLMLSGKQCGDHSAYARNPDAVQCFL